MVSVENGHMNKPECDCFSSVKTAVTPGVAGFNKSAPIIKTKWVQQRGNKNFSFFFYSL